MVATGGAPVGYDTLEGALTAARHYGDGTEIVDTGATPYHPMVQRIVEGRPVFLEHGAWDTRADPALNLIEAIKKGHLSIVLAFLAKGADPGARDRHGATALHWAVARRNADVLSAILAAGADFSATDDRGDTALALARRKNLSEMEMLLRQAGVTQ